MYKDVHVLEISNNKNTGKKDKNVRIKATLNINRFFPVYHKLNGSRGEVKGRRKCKTCLYICVLSPVHLWLIESPATSDGNSYTKWTTLITDELTTMCRHMQTYHAVITYPKHILLFYLMMWLQGLYRKWCQTKEFLSMLREDSQKQWKDAVMTAEQSTVDLHFQDFLKVQPYSDNLMKEAAIKWLIQTNQVCSTNFHVYKSIF